mmetsp:Transcript_29610/g.49769  ORF Transcript_29610/g.49769 Transcript_29610/m.49769 type:complete len:208 (+) Transcript_29610:99-722(+)
MAQKRKAPTARQRGKRPAGSALAPAEDGDEEEGPPNAVMRGSWANRSAIARAVLAFIMLHTVNMAGFAAMSTIMTDVFEAMDMMGVPPVEILGHRTALTAAFWVEGGDLTWMPDRAKPPARVLKSMFAGAGALLDVFDAMNPSGVHYAPPPAAVHNPRSFADGTDAMLAAASAREAAANTASGSGALRPPGIFGGGFHSPGPWGLDV